MGSLIRGELARIMLEDISDPAVKNLVVNEVELSSDLKHARVFFSLFESNSTQLKEVDKGLHRAQTFLKRKLGENLKLRFVPELNFIHDTHTESVTRLYDLFEEVGSVDHSAAQSP